MSWIFRGRTWKARRAFNGSRSDIELPRAEDQPGRAALISGTSKEKCRDSHRGTSSLFYQQIKFPVHLSFRRLMNKEGLADLQSRDGCPHEISLRLCCVSVERVSAHQLHPAHWADRLLR